MRTFFARVETSHDRQERTRIPPLQKPGSRTNGATSSCEPDLFSKLTHRQREVLTLLAQRLSDSKVERLLNIAEATWPQPGTVDRRADPIPVGMERLPRLQPMAREKPDLLIIDWKRLRQAGIMRLLDIWADAMGLTVKAVVPDARLDTCCEPAHCELAIISVGGASIEDAQHQALIKSVCRLMPQAPLIIISDREEPQEICTAFEAGAAGFLPSSIEPAVALQVLSLIRSGGSFVPPSVLSACLRPATVKGMVRASDLTSKQEKVIGFLCQGYPNKTIARQLGMSEATVKVHVRRILHKFGVANRTQLAIAAMNEISCE